MTATTLPTPADLSITPRDRRFGRDAATPRLWHGGRVEATAIYNALSATFPIGETYFVESVRAFRERWTLFVDELFAEPDIDGGLIGGASLKAADFIAICRAAG